MNEREKGAFEKRFREKLAECGLALPGGRVLAAVSGGADSVCLLALLGQLKDQGQIRLRAVHIHHGLRGEEADRDADWVRSLCQRLQVPCQVFYEDVRAFAASEKLSEEEAGRILRYRRLEEAAKQWEAEEKEAAAPLVLIAVAHHQEDQAETILHNLCRGSGLRGMGGMEKRRGPFIRPLLEESRRQILKWLEEMDIPYCQDSTNLSGCYTRNRIRSQLIPLICREVNEKGVENIARMGQMAAMADEYLEEQAGQWLKEKGQVREHGIFLPEKSFCGLSRIIRLYVLREVLSRQMGGQRDLGWLHVKEAEELFEKQTGRRIDLPRGVLAVREYAGVFLGTKTGEEEPVGGLPAVRMQRFPWKKGMEFPKKQYTKWFDCDKIKGTPELRFRREGDYITLPGGKRKALRRYMIDEKIPSSKRERVPLLADGSHIIWIIGYRISEYYKVGPDTSRILCVQAEWPGEGRDGNGENKNTEDM